MTAQRRRKKHLAAERILAPDQLARVTGGWSGSIDTTLSSPVSSGSSGSSTFRTWIPPTI